MQVSWIESNSVPALPVTQVYGYCFNKDGKILLVKDWNIFTLPGGTPESGETIEDTLRREVLEEAQVILIDSFLIGYQLVQGDMQKLNGNPYAQLRMIARIKEFLPNAVDPATGRIYQRVMCSPEQAVEALNWGESGQAQIYAACHMANAQWNIDMSSNLRCIL